MATIIKTEPIWEAGYECNRGQGMHSNAPVPESGMGSPGKERNVAELERQLATNLTITENENAITIGTRTITTRKGSLVTAGKARQLGAAKNGKISTAQKVGTLEKENQHLKHIIEELKQKLTTEQKNYLAEKTVADMLSKVMQGEKTNGHAKVKEHSNEAAEQSNLTKFLEERNTCLEENVVRLEKELSETITKSKKLAEDLNFARQSVVLLTDKLQSSEQANKALKKDMEDLNKQIEASKLKDASNSQRLNVLEERVQQTAIMSEEVVVLRSQLEESKNTLVHSENTIGELQASVKYGMQGIAENEALKNELSQVKDELQKTEIAMNAMVEKLADHETTKLLSVKLRSDLMTVKCAYKSLKEKKKRLKVKALKKCRALRDLECKWKGITVFFRKLEEKSAKGQLLSRADFDAALNYLISSSLTCDGTEDCDIKKELGSGTEDKAVEDVYLDSSSDEDVATVCLEELDEPDIINESNAEVDCVAQVSLGSGRIPQLPAGKRPLPKHDMEKMVKKLKEVSITTTKPSATCHVVAPNAKSDMPSRPPVNPNQENKDDEIVIIDSDSDEVIEAKKNSTRTVQLRTSTSCTAKLKTRSQKKIRSIYKLRRSRSVSKPRRLAALNRERSSSVIREKCHSHKSRSCSWTSDSRSRSNSRSKLHCQRESHTSYAPRDYSWDLREYKLSRQRQQRSRSRSSDSCYSICCEKSHCRSELYHRHHSGHKHYCSSRHNSSKRLRKERRRSRSVSRTRRRYPSLSRRRKLRSESVESLKRCKKLSPKSDNDRSPKEYNSTRSQDKARNKSTATNDRSVLSKTSLQKSNKKSHETRRTKENLEDLLRARLKEVENEEKEDGECSEHGSDPTTEKNKNSVANCSAPEISSNGAVSTTGIEKNLSALSVHQSQPFEGVPVAQAEGSHMDVIPVKEINLTSTAASEVLVDGILLHPPVHSQNSPPSLPAVPLQPPPFPPSFPRVGIVTYGNSPCPTQISIRPDGTRSTFLMQNTSSWDKNCRSVYQFPVLQSQSSCEATSSPTYLPHEPEFEAQFPAYFGVNQNPNYDWLNSSQMQNQRNNFRINNHMPSRRNKMRTQSRVNSVNIYLPKNHPNIVRRNKKPIAKHNNPASAVIPLELNVIDNGQADRGIDVVDAIMQKYTVSVVKEIPGYSGKHPIQALMELCEARQWPAPSYTYEAETNAKARELNYFCDVLINNVLYKPKLGSKNKKDAQALAAMYCLQQLGEKP